MDIFDDFWGVSTTDDSSTINPANGLPMQDGIGSFDIMGNSFGDDSSTDMFSSDDTFSSDDMFD